MPLCPRLHRLAQVHALQQQKGSTQAALDALRLDNQRLQSQLGQRGQEVGALRALVQQLEGQVQQLEGQLSDQQADIHSAMSLLPCRDGASRRRGSGAGFDTAGSAGRLTSAAAARSCHTGGPTQGEGAAGTKSSLLAAVAGLYREAGSLPGSHARSAAGSPRRIPAAASASGYGHPCEARLAPTLDTAAAGLCGYGGWAAGAGSHAGATAVRGGGGWQDAQHCDMAAAAGAGTGGGGGWQDMQHLREEMAAVDSEIAMAEASMVAASRRIVGL